MELAFLILGFIIGFLLGMILEKWKCQKKVNKIFDEALKEINKDKEKK